MAKLTQELIDLIKDRVGRFSTDVLVGWEAGMLGKERVGRRLFDRLPPEHFTGPRRDDWYAGHRAGLAERKSAANEKTVTFVGENKDGNLIVTRKGWGVRRGEVVTQLERKGAYGLVMVFYRKGGKIIRTVNCQI